MCIVFCALRPACVELCSEVREGVSVAQAMSGCVCVIPEWRKTGLQKWKNELSEPRAASRDGWRCSPSKDQSPRTLLLTVPQIDKHCSRAPSSFCSGCLGHDPVICTRPSSSTSRSHSNCSGRQVQTPHPEITDGVNTRWLYLHHVLLFSVRPSGRQRPDLIFCESHHQHLAHGPSGGTSVSFTCGSSSSTTSSRGEVYLLRPRGHTSSMKFQLCSCLRLVGPAPLFENGQLLTSAA